MSRWSGGRGGWRPGVRAVVPGGRKGVRGTERPTATHPGPGAPVPRRSGGRRPGGRVAGPRHEPRGRGASVSLGAGVQAGAGDALLPDARRQPPRAALRSPSGAPPGRSTFRRGNPRRHPLLTCDPCDAWDRRARDLRDSRTRRAGVRPVKPGGATHSRDVRNTLGQQRRFQVLTAGPAGTSLPACRVGAVPRVVGGTPPVCTEPPHGPSLCCHRTPLTSTFSPHTECCGPAAARTERAGPDRRTPAVCFLRSRSPLEQGVVECASPVPAVAAAELRP